MSVAPRALLADATWLGTLAALRSLSAHGVAVTIGCDSWLAPSRWSRFASETIKCPSSKNAAAFLSWLLCFGAEQPGYVLYPTSDEVAWLVAAHSEDLSRYYSLYTPPIGSLIRILDKACLVKEAEAAGLDAPQTMLPSNNGDVERFGREMGFPVYVKPRAQLFAHGVSKGVRVNYANELRACWQAQLDSVIYSPAVAEHIPNIKLPMLQRSVCSPERIYTVDGFVDETGDIYGMLACQKVLQRPRGSGPGIVFEHAQLDPMIERGLLRLFKNVGFYGVFDAEFLETDDKRLLIDINPRFYNHMAFESERGLHLPWLAYLAATKNRDALKAEFAKFRESSISRSAYVHRLPLQLLLAMQRLGGRMSAADQRQWRRRISKYADQCTDPVRVAEDPTPALAEIAMEAYGAARHPRSYLRGLLKSVG